MNRQLSKAMTRLACQRILNRGVGIVGFDDHVFLLSEVFPRHESWAEKQGPGVDRIEVRRHGAFKSLGFFLVRTDGSVVDISYKVAIDGRGTVQSRFSAAARNEIQPQVSSWKLRHPPPGAGMHADHVVPLERLLTDWLQQIELQPQDIATTRQSVGHCDLFLDRSAALSWQRHHARHARLQWLSAADNMRKGRNICESVELIDA